jgi:eukaryotic-like serine/threonine-protein kinase
VTATPPSPARLSDAAVAHLRLVADWPDLSDTRYEIVEPIGRGGMGTVYRALDVQLGREVALKVMHSPHVAPGDEAGAEDAARTLREARTIARLEHPGIVPVHDVGTLPDGRVFYAMKLVRGARLDAYAAAVGRSELLRLFVRICEAVAFAHAHGVIHRDLKPQNVMVGPFGEVLVMDWGVAKDKGSVLRDSCSVETTAGGSGFPRHDTQHATRNTDQLSTSPGTVLGTPGYMAPEQADAGAADERSDVYALGAILRDLLRAGGDDGDVVVPAPLAAVVARAMAPDPAARYQHAAALAADVLAYLEARPVSAHREGILERARRVGAKYRTPILLVLAYLVMRAALLLFATP